MVLCPLCVAVDSVLSLYAYKVEDIYVADGKIVKEVKKLLHIVHTFMLIR